jgi:DNA-binding NarL/FixJ family response regulator
MAYSVLIVQDKQPHRHMPADAATLSGLEVIGQAVGPIETQAALRDQPADVILMDLALSVEDSLPEVRRLRQQLPNALVVVCATFDGAAEVSHAFAAGVHRCLRKPYRADELRRLFENLREELEQTVPARG